LAFLLFRGPEAWGFNRGLLEVKLFEEVMSIGILKLSRVRKYWRARIFIGGLGFGLGWIKRF